ncbi:hypothetical protein [Marinicella meishanensis]|uniref:hypothetical protein n=1 Tax=Marinicella meishanensis TaxID=2873263 RepID=UPI001CBCA5F3|nr:hypothetical protein [Marinicella sp. NBU2979]
MRTDKKQLLDGLHQSGWELVTVHEDSEEWFIDEQWVIQSIQENWGLQVLITFLIDPQFERPRKKGQGVWLIMASLDSPHYFSKAKNQICELTMSKRKFQVKLEEFIQAINHFRVSFCLLP